jgi:hypothetical protein
MMATLGDMTPLKMIKKKMTGMFSNIFSNFSILTVRRALTGFAFQKSNLQIKIDK